MDDYGMIGFNGNINVEDIDYQLSYACNNASYKGFNLIGNPYPHDIYKGVAFSNAKLEDKYCVLNADGTWTLTDDNVAIKPCEAVLVQAKEPGTLTFTNTAANTKSRSTNDNIWFTLENSEFTDVACVEFAEGRGFNKIAHRNGSAPMMYIRHNDEDFASVNIDADAKVINIGFEAKTTGKYTLKVNTAGDFSYMHLIDKLTGNDVDLLVDNIYEFIGTPKDDKHRFIVRLGYHGGQDNSGSFAFQNGTDLIVTGDGTLQVFDLMGRLVMTRRINGVETINVPDQGVYILKMNGMTQKIVIR